MTIPPEHRVQIVTADGQTLSLSGRVAEMVLLVVEAQPVLEARDKGSASFHFAGPDLTFVPAPIYRLKRRAA